MPGRVLPFIPRRRTEPELLDLPAVAHLPEELAGSLADIRVVNRHLGDTTAVIRHLSRMVRRHGKDLFTVLDIGTGSADIPAAIAAWARRTGTGMAVTAVDVNPHAIEIARKKARPSDHLSFAVADARGLPFRENSFDFAICSKTLHHFTEDEAVTCIRESNRVARLGYLFLDLRRSWIAWALICILTRLFTTNRLTRNDGPLSVLKAFTPPELAALASRAGVRRFEVSREPFWLMALTGECP